MESEALVLETYGKVVLEWICEYWKGSRQRPEEFVPLCLPGNICKHMPAEAPTEPEPFDAIWRDLNTFILPNTLEWMNPHFHAYFPSANSAASLFGDLISGAINAIGFSWISNPSGTELEVHVIDWLAKMLNLPDDFHFASGKNGGGVIVGSASEGTLLALMSARERCIRNHSSQNPFCVMSKMIGYTSKEAHSSVRRAGLLARCTIRLVSLQNGHGMDKNKLRRMISEDFDNGLIPTFVCATLGTTGVCAFDNLDEIGTICRSHGIWLHVDAAYGGNALICPEYQHFGKGVEFVDSFVVSPHKWMLVNYDCSIMWLRNHLETTIPFLVEPEYLKHSCTSDSMPDYRHWHISCGRRFRALKLWFVIRMHGVSGLQDNIRRQVQRANEFAAEITAYTHMQVISNRMGVVAFRLKGPNVLTENLLLTINATRCVKMVHTKIGGRFAIRFVVSGFRSNSEDVSYACNIVRACATAIIEKAAVNVNGLTKRTEHGNCGSPRNCTYLNKTTARFDCTNKEHTEHSADEKVSVCPVPLPFEDGHD